MKDVHGDMLKRRECGGLNHKQLDMMLTKKYLLYSINVQWNHVYIVCSLYES